MRKGIGRAALLAFMLALPVVAAAQSARGGTARPRPEGPCDIYAAAGTPCVAAHSSTRALLASYNGPLYKVMRQSDGRTLDVGVAQPIASPVPDAGGYADAAAQDRFCAGTYCWITTLYDQSGKGNHLVQAPRGAFIGSAMGGFNTLPIADMAPVTLMGRKVYGTFIAPGMGLRWNDPRGTAVDDQAEGQYWVINGQHYNSGCCFDYGNAETDSRDDGDGTMETTYYGNATLWYYGTRRGPWVMTDQENNLVGCVNESPNDKHCPDLPTITWRFVTATADGEPHHWRTLAGDAQRGELQVMFDGPRIKNDRSSYDPMRKQGAIVLGNGGDNNNYSQGTFYEGAMTAPGTFPSMDTYRKIQANIVAARYDVPRLVLAPASAVDAPPGLQTFSPGSSRSSTLTFTNTTGAPASNVKLSLTVPAGWRSVAAGSTDTFASVAAGGSVSVTFKVTSGPTAFNGDLVGNASWTSSGRPQSEVAAQKVRNVSPVKLNEFRVSAGANTTDSFIELYNAGNAPIDMSGWTLTQHQTQLPSFSAVRIPAATRLAPHGFYLLGLSTSGLAVPARRGDATIYVRSTKGMSVGGELQIGTGSALETRRIVSVGTAAGLPAATGGGFGFNRAYTAGGPTTLWQPLPDGPVITIPAGSTNVPVASVAGFEVGQKMAIGHGATYPAVGSGIEKYEVVTVTGVGKPGTQAWLSREARKGDTNIKVSSTADISVGDRIRLDIDSKGHGIEWVTVTRVGTPSVRNTVFGGPLREGEDPGTGLDLAEPLKFEHAPNMPFSVRGTGIGFTPATRFAHSSNEPVLPLGTGITMDQPLSRDYPIDAVVRDPNVSVAGYQGAQAPNQWFGGPALSPSAGNMVLRDAPGNVVESLNYGALVEPWAAEGYQGTSGAGYQSGCSVGSPGTPPARPGFGAAAPPADVPNRSAGRLPDGQDTDSNCNNFQLQAVANLAAAAVPGSDNLKVGSVDGLAAGQRIMIGSAADVETAVIAAVGTPGASTLRAATETGATIVPVVSITGFTTGQTITIGSGTNQETAVVASTSRGSFRGPGGPGGQAGPTITVTAPLTSAHAADVQVSGSGITLTTALTRTHASGAVLTDELPTPGAPNQFQKRMQ